jgi:hypothetical protein
MAGNAGREPTRADYQASLGLADREGEIVEQAAVTRRLVEAEGSAVAFAEVLRQVHTDMGTVTARLRRADPGVVTVTIENDIIATLEEMIEALEKARHPAHADGPRPPREPGDRPEDPRLIDRVAELKMIRSLQLRVNARTEVYSRQYEGEQAPPPAAAEGDGQRERYERIRGELKELAGRQGKIGKVTRDIATNRNEAR